MNERERFFYDHAGYSYDPQTETAEQERSRCAHELAVAETWAQQAGVTFAWEDDPDARLDYTHEEQPETCEQCSAWSLEGEWLAGLGAIADATDDYRRVVQAELALEAREALTLH